MTTKPAKPPKKTASKPKKTAKRKPTAKQIEAQKNQKALEREFKKQQKRVLGIISRGEAKDYTFDSKLKDQVMKTPKKITPASIRRISAYTPDAIYKRSSKVFVIDGKEVLLKGLKAKKHERSERAKKSAQARRMKKSFKAIIERGGLDSIPKWENETEPPKGMPKSEKWADHVEGEFEKEREALYGLAQETDDEGNIKLKPVNNPYNKTWQEALYGFDSDTPATESEVAAYAMNMIMSAFNGYLNQHVPTAQKIQKRLLESMNEMGVIKAFDSYLDKGLGVISISSYMTSNQWQLKNTLEEQANKWVEAGFITEQEYDDLIEEIQENYEVGMEHYKKQKKADRRTRRMLKSRGITI